MLGCARTGCSDPKIKAAALVDEPVKGLSTAATIGIVCVVLVVVSLAVAGVALKVRDQILVICLTTTE